MQLKKVLFGIEFEMFGYYTNEQFINIIHKECEKRLLPVSIIDGSENDDAIIPEGQWMLKGDGSIIVPKSGIATQIQQVGYRKGEQMFLQMGKLKHEEPETGVYDTDRGTPQEIKGMIDQELNQNELPWFGESRIVANPDIIAGDEKIKAYKVSRGGAHTQENQYNDFELVSPPLKFVDSNIKLVGELADVLKRMRMKVNASTGVHIHVSFPEINLFTFIKIMNFIDEYKIEELWPTRFNKTYAKSKNAMKDDIEEYLEDMSNNVEDGKSHFLNYAKINRLMPMAEKISDRYFGINIQSFGHHGTIEFRYASGSLKSSEITEWMKYIRDLIDYCIKVKEVTNFLGRFDIKEEREGDIQIYDSRNKVTIKSENLIDKFTYQKNNLTTFFQAHNIIRNDVMELILEYLSNIGILEIKNTGNILNNIIKFCNALINENVFGFDADEFSNYFFDLYVNTNNSSIEEYVDLEDVHQDTFTHILQQTAFKKMNSDKISRFINFKDSESETKTNRNARELIASLVIHSKEDVINKLEINPLVTTANVIYIQEEGDTNKKIYSFFKKIGSHRTKLILDNDYSKIKFKNFLHTFEYSQTIFKSIIDVGTSKGFLKKHFDKDLSKKIKKDAMFIKNDITFYANTLGVDDMMSTISSYQDKFAISLYNCVVVGHLTDSNGKEFVKKYVKKVANSSTNAFIKFADKDLSNKKVTTFDLYEVLISLAEEDDLYSTINGNSKSKYGLALYNGKNFINQGSGEIVGVSKINIYDKKDDPYYTEESKQHIIDLFKLLFKKYNKNKLQFIWGFSIQGVDEFIKPEYLNNIREDDVNIVINHYALMALPIAYEYKFAPLLMKALVEKSDIIKNKFITQMFFIRRSIGDICKLIKEVIDNIDTPEFIKNFKNADENLERKIEIYRQIMNSTAVQKIELDTDLFDKEVKDLFKLNSENEKDFKSLMRFFKINYDKNKNLYLEGQPKIIAESLPDKDKLIVRFAIENEPLNDFLKNKFLDYIKSDDDFLKKVFLSYEIIQGYSGVSGKAIKSSSFFIDVCFAMGKKINNNIDTMIYAIPTLYFGNDDINYTKLSMLNNKIIDKFMINNLSTISEHTSISHFWAVTGSFLTDIYDKIIANKKIYKILLKSSESNIFLRNHLSVLFYYRKMKKMNLKIKSRTSNDYENSNFEIEFKIDDKKYKIDCKIENQLDEKPNSYIYEVSFIVDGKVVKSEKFSADGFHNHTPDDGAAFTYIRNEILDKPLNKAFNKHMDMKPLGINKIRLIDFIIQGARYVRLTNKKFEFKASPKKKLNESVIVEHIDYHKEFKSIMIKKGVSDAKKFLIENKNYIEDRKLLAMMKQFNIS